MKLPKGLSSYQELLAGFPPQLAQALVPWIGRLHDALGRPQIDASMRGVPNGYDGVDRAGDYDRLLASEWLWADVQAEEFIRRAAMREQLFFRRAYETPKSGRRVVAVFDSGPNQLGALRLVHLALLIVLQRRAQQNGGSLEWGSLQDPQDRYEGASEQQVRKLLSLRTLALPAEHHFSAWQENITNHSKARGHKAVPSEIWWIGTPPPKSTCAIALEQCPDGVQVGIKLRGSATKQLVLPLPPFAVGRRLLTDPFAKIEANAERAVISRTASRVVFGRPGGKIEAVNPAREVPKATAQLKPLSEEDTLAVDYSRGGITAFCHVPGKQRLRIWRGEALEPWRDIKLADLPAPFVAPEPGNAFLPCAFFGRRTMHALLVDAAGTLFSLASIPRVLATHVVAFACTNNLVAVMSMERSSGGVPYSKVDVYDSNLNLTSKRIPSHDQFQGHLGFYSSTRLALTRSVRLTGNQALWTVGTTSAPGGAPLELPPGESAVGVGAIGTVVGVFVVHGHSVYFVGVGHRKRIHKAPALVQRLNTTGAAPLLLLQLTNGVWQLVDYTTEKVVREWGNLD